MKKVKYIALVLVIMLAMVGGAYAAWTDTVVVDGRASTGNMKVVFTEADLSAGGPYEVIDNAYVTDGGQKLVVRMSKLYPRNDFLEDAEDEDYAYIWFQFKNVGTVPVVFDSATAVAAAGNQFPNINRLKFGDPSFTATLGEIPGALSVWSDAQGPILPGEDKRIKLHVWLDKDAPNSYQNLTAAFEVKVNWKQANMQ